MNRLLGDALAEFELNPAERHKLRSDEASTETSGKRSHAEKGEVDQADETHKTDSNASIYFWKCRLINR